MIEVQGPDGAIIEFPNGTPQDTITKVMASRYGGPSAASGETSIVRDIGGALLRGVGQVVSTPGQLAGLVTGDFDNPLTRAGRAVEEFGQEIQTPAFRAQQEESQRRVEKAEREGGFFAGAGQQVRELASDPMMFAAGLAQTAPAMVGTGGAGLAGRGIARVAARRAGEQAGRRAATIGATAGVSGASGAMVAGDAGAAVYERVQKLPQETLNASPRYQEAIAAGQTPEEARESVAVDAARIAAIPAGALSAATTGAFGIEGALLSGGFGRGVVRGLFGGAAREGAQEAVEEGGQAALENVAVQTVDPSVGLLDNVGGRTAAGAVLGMGLGAPTGAAGALAARRPAAITEEPTDAAPVETPAEPAPMAAPIATPAPVSEQPGTPVDATPVDVPDTAVPVPGAVPAPVGTGDFAEVLTDAEGFVTATRPTGEVQTFTPDEWESYTASLPAPASEPTVSEPTPITTPEPIAEPEPTGTPVTPEAFRQADTPSLDFQRAIQGKPLSQVARVVADRAVLDTTKSIMSRAAGVLDSFEKAGIQTELGISGQRPQNAASAIMERQGPQTRGIGGYTGTGRIVVGLGGVKRKNPGVNEITAAHELIHAVTLTSINGKRDLPKNSRVLAATNGLEQLFTETKAQVKNIPLPDGSNSQWMKDPAEFIAYGMTDYNFQQWLKTVPTKTGNAFTDFVNYIARILGVPKGEMNALTRLIELSEDMIPVEAAEIAAVTEGAGRTLGVTGQPVGAAVIAESMQADDTPLALPKPSPFRTRWLDRLDRLRQAESIGTLVNANRSAYEAGRKFEASAAARLEKADRDHFKPILEGMQKAGINLNQMDHYLWARTAGDRNARFRESFYNDLIKKTISTLENRSKMKYLPDYVGQGDDPQVIFNKKVEKAVKSAHESAAPPPASGMDNETAATIIADTEALPNGAEYKRIAEMYDRMTGENRQNMVKGSLEKKETIDFLEKAEPRYAPLKARAASKEDLTVMAEDDLLSGYNRTPSGRGYSITRKEWQKTKGRTTPPFSPLATAISDFQTTIIRAERNKVGNLGVEFMLRNPSDSWKVYSERNRPRDRNGNLIQIRNSDPNWLITKINGVPFYAYMSDAGFARAMKNLSAEEMQPALNNIVLRSARTLTRAFSRSLTTANPVFTAVNLARDLAAANLNLMENADTQRLQGDFNRFVFERSGNGFWASWNYETGSGNADPDMLALYEQFKLDGGATGWTNRNTPEEIAERINSDYATLEMMQEELSVPRSPAEAKRFAARLLRQGTAPARALIRTVEHVNSVFENSIRFAAYRAALNNGYSREKAAMLSREITVDFNKAGETARVLNMFFAFLNASIQGSARTIRSLSNNPFKTGRLSGTQAMVMGMGGIAAALALYNAAVSEDDEDGKSFYDKIPMHEKERNLIIMNPDGRRYVKVPLPYGFAWFPFLATRVTDAIRTGDTMGQVGLDLTTSFMMNFSPVQVQSSDATKAAWKIITPTVGRPFVDALLLNENAFGKPIANKPFSDAQAPSSVARYSTPEGYKWLAEFLNDISGGDGKKRGFLSEQPEKYQYVLEYALAGPKQYLGWLADTPRALGLTEEAPEDLTIKDVPFANKFIGEPQKGRNVGEYYQRVNTVQSVQMQLKALQDEGDREGIAALRERYPAETSGAVSAALKRARRQIRDINERRKRIDRADIPLQEIQRQKGLLDERAEQVFVEFNRVYNRQGG